MLHRNNLSAVAFLALFFTMRAMLRKRYLRYATHLLGSKIQTA
jgi:hypothetical protein